MLFFLFLYEGDIGPYFMSVFQGPSANVLEYMFCYCAGLTATLDNEFQRVRVSIWCCERSNQILIINI